MSPPKNLLRRKAIVKVTEKKNRATYQKNDAERKRAQREKVKLLNPELCELKKKRSVKESNFLD